MTSRARFAAAGLVSAALHALVIYGVTVPVPRAPGAARPLEARLAPPPVAKPAPVIRQAAKQRRPAQRRPAPAEPPPATVAAASPFALPPEAPPEAAPVEPQQPEALEPAAPPQQVASAPASIAAPPVHTLPRRGRITYTLLYGENRGYVGTAVQSWEAEGGAYVLASDAETGGIVELFRPQRLRYLSQGKITAGGLRPESFLLSRTRRGQTEAARARFDWDGGSLTYGNADERKRAALPEGAQDIMSFVYQLALVPPEPGRHRLAITNGSRFETYEIEVLGEERIETPIGTLRALPVRQIRQPGEESLELWLAAEYRYLPVRIHYYDREGRFSGEQVVSEIRLSEE